MTTIRKIAAFGLMTMTLATMLAMVGCKKDDAQPETERVKALLKANSWRIQSVMVDGIDQSILFAGLTLSFTERSYTTTNGGLVWPASGDWEFVDGSGKKIKRSDSMEITIDEVLPANLKLSLTRTSGSLGSGRVGSIAGKHVFSFIK